MHIQIEPLQSPTSRYQPIFICFIYEKAFNLSVPLHHRQYINLIRSYLISSHLISSHLISSHLISSHLISSHLISSHLISSHLTIRELVPRYNISHTVRQN
eukprot:888994_1